MLSRRLRILLLLAQTVGLFALCYYYVFLRIRPELFYQQKPHVFLFDSHFFYEMVSQPGGVVDYLDAFLSPLLVSDSLGALVVALLVMLICWATRGLLGAVGGRGGQLVYLLPAVGIVMLVGQYIHPIWLCVGLSLVLLAANLYVRLGNCGVGARVVVFAIGSLLVYFAAAGMYLVFACICGCYEWRARRERWIGLAYVGCAAAVPYAASWWPFDLVFPEAYRGLMLPPGQHWLAIPSSMPLAVAIYSAAVVLPLLAVLVFTWRRRPSAEVPVNPEDSSGETGATADGSGLVRWWVHLAVPLTMLLLFVLADLVAFDSAKRCLLEIETNSEQQQWDAVLAWAEELPFPDARAYDPRILYCINRALYFEGRLLDRMFEYPQVLFTPSLTLVDADIDATSRLTPRQCSEIFFDLGRVNESEQMSYEALEQCGNRPEILKRLASIQLIKGKPEAARRFLLLLERSLMHRGWARQMLGQLEDEPQAVDASLVSFRELAVQRDSLGNAGDLETMLEGLLERNPENRMALEYLTAHYLLTRRADRLAAYRQRFGRPGQPGLPRYVEEALAYYGATAGKEELERIAPSIRPEVWQRFAEFIETEQKSRGDKEVAFEALCPDFHDSYFFCFVFGHNISSLGVERSPE
jgi:uncharacterized protein DUF6057